MMVCHHGGAAAGGHYTADVLDKSPNGESKWVRFDDERVHGVTAKQVCVCVCVCVCMPG